MVPSAVAPTDELVVEQSTKETLREAYTRLALQPTAQAAQSLSGENSWGRPVVEPKHLPSVMRELQRQAAAVSAGDLSRPEAMLVSQMHVLDGMFSDLARRARANIHEHPAAGERYLRLALKAQSHCRATIETLAEVRNPRAVAFVKQANISSGPQQVNNGAAAEPASRERAANRKSPNELIEANSDELDTRAPRAAVETYSSLAAVVPIDRAKVGSGKGSLEGEQSEARRVQQ